MTNSSILTKIRAEFPSAKIGHFPTPLEPMKNLGRELGLNLWVKRDDCSGIGFGGNKVRQLDFYFGEAQSQNADTVLITGAVQSNFARTAAAVASSLGMECHVQQEERVANATELHRQNGNVLLYKLTGATLHSYPDGEDEVGADANVHAIANTLKQQGRVPYVIPLSVNSKPLGALGYVLAAEEFLQQIPAGSNLDTVVVGSGSALTHAGLLFGLRALGSSIKVYGICVRRESTIQKKRVQQRLQDINDLIGSSQYFSDDDVQTFDGAISPGYGQLNDETLQAIKTTARTEGLYLDPVYTGKVMAGLIQLQQEQKLAGRNVVFWHSGGTPALFAYADQIADALDND